MSNLKNRDISLISLNDLGTWCGGGTPSKQVPAYWDNGTIPWVSPKDMKVEHIRDAEDTITEKAVKESATNLLPAGAVLVVTRSGILRHTFPVAVTDVPVTINQDLKALVPNKGVDPKYVAYGLRAFSREILNQCSKQGTTVNSIETKELLRFQIPLFSTYEQTRIVAEIEKHFSRLDEAVANLKRVKANLKRYKAAVLKAAVEGKLTEEWRRGAIHRAQQSAECSNQGAKQGAMNCAPTETGAELLERILAERRKAAGKGKYKEPVTPDTSGLPELPAGWVWASLDQISSKVTSGSRDWSPYYGRGNAIFVLAQNVRPISPDFTAKQLVDPPSGDPACARSLLRTDDLMVTIVGANAGQVCRVNHLPGIAYVCQSVALIRPAITNTSEYLNFWLNSKEHGQRYFEQCMYGQGRPHLSFEQLTSTPIAFPPLAEQRQIVAEVERRLSIVAGAEAQVDANLRRADRLRQSILKQAFAGQLVPQDPNDEPASVLLERIRANAPSPQPLSQRARGSKAAPLPRGEGGRRPGEGINNAPKPATFAGFACLDDISAAILAAMQPGRDYARAELADPLGLSTGQWNVAIQELKRRGQVRQTGEKRGARYKTAGGGT